MGSVFRTSLEQRSNPYPKEQKKIHLHRAHFCYPNQHRFLAFPRPFWKPIFRFYPQTSCVPVSFTVTVIYVDRVFFLKEVLGRLQSQDILLLQHGEARDILQAKQETLFRAWLGKSASYRKYESATCGTWGIKFNINSCFIHYHCLHCSVI